MRKILIMFIMLVLLVGCKKDEFSSFKDNYIEEHGITDIEEITSYGDKPYIEDIIFKGLFHGTEEELYFCEGLPGKGDGIFSNGEYGAGPLSIEEGMRYRVYDGKDFGYDRSYFVAMVYRKMSVVYYKGESIDFKTVDVQLNDKDITLTVWLMPFSNGDEISLSDFEYQE